MICALFARLPTVGGAEGSAVRVRLGNG